MYKKYYIMSDIHGCYDKMMKALEHWDSKSEHLVILGDLIDRGPDSLKVITKLMELTEAFPENVTVLKGNHEDMFLSWLLETPEELFAYFYSEMHRETLQSFMGDKFGKSSRTQRANHILYNNKKELSFLRSRQLYLETDHFVLVHAGLNLEALDWRDCHKDLLWIRNEFIYSKNPLEKRVFFGHTPTSFINEKDSRNKNDIWISPCGNKVGIDGGASMGGQLNALKINESGAILETFIIK